MATEIDDATLVRSVRGGDVDAFEALYERHAGAVRTAARERGITEDGVGDAAQLTFARALERLAELADDATFGPWLLTHVTADATGEAGSDRVDLSDVRELSAFASRPYAELDPDDAQALAMAGYLDSTLDQIGQHRGESAQAAEGRLARAARRLRRAAELEALVRRAAALPAGVLHISGDGEVRRVPIFDAVYIGRECAGVADDQRVILTDPAVSRLHLVLRIDAVTGRAMATDHSRNGTLLNGAEMPAGTPIVLLDGDTLRVGATSLMVRTEVTSAVPRLPGAAAPASEVTSFAVLPAVTAVATSPGEVPDDLVDRLIAAAGLFGAVADRMPGSLVMVRWPSGNVAESERQCARYLDFAKLLAGNARLPIEWSLMRG